jgi:hypothetical protein
MARCSPIHGESWNLLGAPPWEKDGARFDSMARTQAWFDALWSVGLGSSTGV